MRGYAHRMQAMHPTCCEGRSSYRSSEWSVYGERHAEEENKTEKQGWKGGRGSVSRART